MGRPREGPESGEDEAFLDDIASKQNLLCSTEGRASFIRGSEALLAQFQWSAKVPSEKQRRASLKRYGRSLLRLAQECLKAPQVKDVEVHSLLYEQGCRAMGVVQELWDELHGTSGRPGLERLIYHAISRALELQRAGDMVGLLNRLGACLESQCGGAAGKEEEEEGGGWDDDDDDDDCGSEDWAAPSASRSSSQGRPSAKAGKKQPKASGQKQEEAGVLSRRLEACAISSRGVGWECSTAKLVAGALVNALRGLAEQQQQNGGGVTTTSDYSQQVADVLGACRAWLQALARLGDTDTARAYGDRALRAAWRAAAAADKAGQEDTACRLRELALELYECLQPCPPSALITQVVRAALVLEKRGASEAALALYERAQPLLLLLPAPAAAGGQPGAAGAGAEGGGWSWWCSADLVPRLEYLRHHCSLLLPSSSSGLAKAQALLQLHRCPDTARALVLLQLVPAAVTTGGAEQRGLVVEEALACLGRWLQEQAEGDGLGAALLLLPKLWKALIRALSTGAPPAAAAAQQQQEASSLAPATLLSGSLAVCHVTQRLLLATPSDKKQQQEDGGLPARSLLQAILHDWRIRAASLLTSSWLLAPSPPPAASSASLPALLPASLPPPHVDPLPLALSLLLHAPPPSSSPSPHRRRLGLCWFSLGRALLEHCHRPLAAVGPLLQACQLLEAEAAAAQSQQQQQAGGGRAGYLEACRSLQLDARLLTLLSCLKACEGQEAAAWARRAVARAALVSAHAQQPQQQRAAHVRKLVRARVLLWPACQGKRSDDEGRPLCEALAGEGQEWAWQLLRQEDEGLLADPSLEACSMARALLEHRPAAPSGVPSGGEEVSVLAREEAAAYEEVLQSRRLDQAQARACVRGHQDCCQVGALGELEAVLARARLLRAASRAGWEEELAEEEEEGAAEQLLQAAMEQVEAAMGKALEGGHGAAWVRACARAEQAALAAEALRRRRQRPSGGDRQGRGEGGDEEREAAGEEEGSSSVGAGEAMEEGGDDDGTGSDGSEQQQSGEESAAVEEEEVEEEDRGHVWADEAVQALVEVVGRRQAGQADEWPEEALGPPEAAMGPAVQRTLELLWQAQAGGGKMLTQAQLLELSLLLDCCGEGPAEARPLESGLLSVAYFLGGCPARAQAYRQAIQQGRTGNKGGAARRGGKAVVMGSSSDKSRALEGQQSRSSEAGVAEEEECGGFQALAAALALAEQEGWPFRAARQQLASLTPTTMGARGGSSSSSLLACLVLRARAELEARAGSPAHALHLLRTLVTNHRHHHHRQQQQPASCWALRVWQADSCLPACLLLMGRAWEELGVAGKARHYYDKAAHLAGVIGARAVQAESRGRARLLRLRERGLEEEGEEEEEAAALVLAERRRRAGRLSEAVEEYGRALASLQQEEQRLPHGRGEEEEGGGGGSEARVEIWRAMGEAVAGMGRRQEGRQLLDRAQAALGGRGTDRALARARLAAWEGGGDGGEWREGALRVGRRTRCPAVYRQLGRGGSSEEEEDEEVRAFLVAASVGTAFWNLPERPGQEAEGALMEGEEGWGWWEGAEDEEEGAWRGRARERLAGLRATLPEGWAVVVLARTPEEEGGALWLARLQQGVGQAVVRRVEGQGVAQVMGAWPALMKRNQRSMMRAEEEGEGSGRVAASWGREQKAAWWAERESADVEMERLLCDLEEALGPWGRAMLLGRPQDERVVEAVESAAVAVERAYGDKEAPQGAALRVALAGVGEEAEVLQVLQGLRGQQGAGLAETVARQLQPLLRPNDDEEEGGDAGAEGGLGHKGRAKKQPPQATACSSQGRKKGEAAALVASRLTVAELRKELGRRGLATSGLKAALVGRLEQAMAEEEDREVPRREASARGRGDGQLLGHEEEEEGEGTGGPQAGRMQGSGKRRRRRRAAVRRCPVVLVLDESLQALPWESMPLLRGQQVVTRCPSLAYVAWALRRHQHQPQRPPKEQGGGGVAAAVSLSGGGLFVLDPEGNLPRTREALEPLLQSCAERLQWQGLVGSPPTTDTLREALPVDGGVFVYCGHGSGEAFWSRHDVATRLQQQQQATPAGKGPGPLAILMGCSSGRLRPAGGELEPTGMVHAWLHGGSPAVLANLWDVTDRDIDRFSAALLQDLLQLATSSSPSAGGLCLGSSVARARQACKLQYLVGAAPVLYGLPLHLLPPEPPRAGPAPAPPPAKQKAGRRK